MTRRRTGRPRTGRWRARLEQQARKTTTSRLRYLLATTTDPVHHEVIAAELAAREDR